MTEKRVVITGMGAVTPLGNTVGATWKALLAGRSGIDAITLFDASTFPTRIAGEIKGLNVFDWKIFEAFRSLGRNSLFALEAAAEAKIGAGLMNETCDPSRLGIYFGAGDGGFDFVQYASLLMSAYDLESSSVSARRYIAESVAHADVKKIIEQEPAQVVHHLAEYFKVKGPVFNCLTACAASSQAIGEAAEIIRRGDADVMITGGAHSMIHPLGMAGFNLLTALSTRNEGPQKASRPFDKERDGFVLSEGGAVLILEELEHAKKRGVRIYAELAGYGSTADAYRMTDPHPEGRGAVRAMRLAMEDAGMNPEDIDYINAHGTSTQLNDQIETASVKQVFGARAYKIPMSSIKSMLGHMIAAAGATELIASILTIRDGIIPPTINYCTPDESCDLDYVPNQARRAKVDAVLSNSFGFGGQNITLIVKRFD